MSESGDTIAIAPYEVTGHIHISKDKGLTWTQKTSALPAKVWNFIAMSTDGTKIIASEYHGDVWRSVDGAGDTWVRSSSPDFSGPSTHARGIAISATGEKVAVMNKYISISTDYGDTFTQVMGTDVGTKSYKGIACSADFKYVT